MTFKDLKKKIINSSNQQQQLQTHSFDKLQNKPFWIWNIEEHKLEDIRTKGGCCFNHIIGLPTKDGLEKPIFDYQELLYEALLAPDNTIINFTIFHRYPLSLMMQLTHYPSQSSKGYSKIAVKATIISVIDTALFLTSITLSLPDYNSLARAQTQK